MAGTAIRLHGVTPGFSRVRAIPLSKAFGCPAGRSFDNVDGMHERSKTDASANAITVAESHDGRVRELRLGGTRGNLITEKLVEELREALRSAAANPKLKLIVIAGGNEHFSYGADVAEHLPNHIARVLPAFHALVSELLACDVPTLARVSGYCLGGGFELALACSMLWCDETAKLGLPEISLGVFPPVAAILLPEKAARNHAAELMLTGRVITGEEAHRMGIANAVAPRSQLETQLHDFVVMYLLPKSASSLRHANAALQAGLRKRYAAEIPAIEALYLQRLMKTHDALEGARAFLDKRVPDWRDS
jgi:cyclohexa-1,5-dienecarbonyl-CoA hydratase